MFLEQTLDSLKSHISGLLDVPVFYSWPRDNDPAGLYLYIYAGHEDRGARALHDKPHTQVVRLLAMHHPENNYPLFDQLMSALQTQPIFSNEAVHSTILVDPLPIPEVLQIFMARQQAYRLCQTYEIKSTEQK